MVFKKNEIEPILLEEGGIILGAMPSLMPYKSAEYVFEKEIL